MKIAPRSGIFAHLTRIQVSSTPKLCTSLCGVRHLRMETATAAIPSLSDIGRISTEQDAAHVLTITEDDRRDLTQSELSLLTTAVEAHNSQDTKFVPLSPPAVFVARHQPVYVKKTVVSEEITKLPVHVASLLSQIEAADNVERLGELKDRIDVLYVSRQLDKDTVELLVSTLFRKGDALSTVEDKFARDEAEETDRQQPPAEPASQTTRKHLEENCDRKINVTCTVNSAIEPDWMTKLQEREVQVLYKRPAGRVLLSGKGKALIQLLDVPWLQNMDSDQEEQKSISTTTCSDSSSSVPYLYVKKTITKQVVLKLVPLAARLMQQIEEASAVEQLTDLRKAIDAVNLVGDLNKDNSDILVNTLFDKINRVMAADISNSNEQQEQEEDDDGGEFATAPCSAPPPPVQEKSSPTLLAADLLERVQRATSFGRLVQLKKELDELYFGGQLEEEDADFLLTAVLDKGKALRTQELQAGAPQSVEWMEGQTLQTEQNGNDVSPRTQQPSPNVGADEALKKLMDKIYAAGSYAPGTWVALTDYSIDTEIATASTQAELFEALVKSCNKHLPKQLVVVCVGDENTTK